jgi:hypothetical protein
LPLLEPPPPAGPRVRVREAIRDLEEIADRLRALCQRAG